MWVLWRPSECSSLDKSELEKVVPMDVENCGCSRFWEGEVIENAGFTTYFRTKRIFKNCYWIFQISKSVKTTIFWKKQ